MKKDKKYDTWYLVNQQCKGNLNAVWMFNVHINKHRFSDNLLIYAAWGVIVRRDSEVACLNPGSSTPWHNILGRGINTNFPHSPMKIWYPKSENAWYCQKACCWTVCFPVSFAFKMYTRSVRDNIEL